MQDCTVSVEELQRLLRSFKENRCSSEKSITIIITVFGTRVPLLVNPSYSTVRYG
jgi:hypothetical protein